MTAATAQIPSVRLTARLLLTAAIIVTPMTARAQQQSQPPAAPARASLDALAWLVGDWEATMPNGAFNETRFMEPRAGIMTGVMRLTNGGTLLVQELVALVETDGGVEMRLRHFGRELNALEAAPMVLRLTAVEPDRAVFEGPYNGAPMRSTVQKIGANGWKGESVFQGRDGKPVTITNVFTRRGSSRSDGQAVPAEKLAGM